MTGGSGVHEVGYHKKSMAEISYARTPYKHSIPYTKTWHKKIKK